MAGIFVIIPFIGGPYDGMRLSPIEIEGIALLVAISTRAGPLKFGLFPSIRDWAAVASGRADVADLENHQHYELVSMPTGPEYRFDPNGEGYTEARLRPGRFRAPGPGLGGNLDDFGKGPRPKGPGEKSANGTNGSRS